MASARFTLRLKIGLLTQKRPTIIAAQRCLRPYSKTSLIPVGLRQTPSLQKFQFSSSTKSNDFSDKINSTNDLPKDYFDVLGVKHSFSLSPDELKSAYKDLMGKFHPDRHTLKSKEERERNAESASEVTRAYGVLSDDHARALHLLELAGSPMDEAVSGGLVGQDFLMEIMELREEVDDKNSDDDLKILLQQNRIRIKDTCSDLSLAFEKRDLSSAMKLTGILQYWNRIEEKIVDKISSVE